MDWLDQYLHELNRPGTVVHLPPDKQSWNRPNPTKQQLSLMQDATIADMVRMRNIQEARQMEMDAGMGGGYDAGSAAKEGPVAPAVTVPDAPVVTSIGSGNTELSAFFAAPASNGGSIITNYKYSIDKGTSFTARSPDSSVSPIKITGLTNGTEYDVRIRAVNTIGDGTVSNALSGTPVAPAPSGIEVATTASVIVAGGGGAVSEGTYTKTTSFGGDPSITTPPTTGEFYRRGYYQLVPPNVGIGGKNPWYDGPTPYFQEAQGIWRIVVLIDNGEGDTIIYPMATNASANNDYIPTAGWSPDITITAA